jgi:hypothetical protein
VVAGATEATAAAVGAAVATAVALGVAAEAEQAEIRAASRGMDKSCSCLRFIWLLSMVRRRLALVSE